MSHKFTVLVLEDEEVAYILIETSLQLLNIRVIHAETGEEGITLFKEKKPDLVLLDINLPDMKGYELIKIFKNINTNIPIVIQTAYDVKSEKQKYMELGCDDFLLKPLTINKIRLIIDKYKK